MSRIGKAPADAPTSTEAEGKTKVTAVEFTRQQYSMPQGYVSRFLLPGSNNAIETKKLLQLTGLKSSRKLQRLIEAERGIGIPILTKTGANGGYYLPSEDPVEAQQECRNFLNYMKGKGIGCLRSMKPARALLKHLEGTANE